MSRRPAVRVSPRRRSFVGVAFVIAAGACSAVGPPVSPSPSVSPPETTPTIEPSASPTTTPAVSPTAAPPPSLETHALATVLVNDLNVRAAPSATAPIVVDEHGLFDEGGGVRLNAGDRVLTLGSTIEAEGTRWIGVAVDALKFVGPYIGWAAAGTVAEPWIQPEDTFCPEPTLAALIALSDLERYGCYASTSIAFDARPGLYPSGDGLGGACPVDPAIAAWLFCDNINYSFVSAEGSEGWDFLLHFDPASGITPTALALEGEPRPMWHITGHFDDPASADCTLDDADAVTAVSVTLMCASRFVVDSLEP